MVYSQKELTKKLFSNQIMMKSSPVTRSRKNVFLLFSCLTISLLFCIASCDKNRKELITDNAEKYLADSLKQKVTIVSVDSINTWRFDQLMAPTKTKIDTLRQNQQKMDEAVRMATKLYNFETGNFIMEVYSQAKPTFQKDMDEISQHYENMYKHKDLVLITYKVIYRLKSDNTYELFVTCDKDNKVFSYQKENTLGNLTDDFPAVCELVNNISACETKILLLTDNYQKLLYMIAYPHLFLR